jgi:hypothetical protein
MAEFLVVCLVLIPLFLAIPLLGKYMDINQNAAQGSRYVAWERTVWTPDKKSNAQLENEVRNRVFTAPGTPLHASDGAGPPAQYNPLWTNPAGQPMLANYGDVTASTETGPGQTSPGLIYNKVTSTLVDIFNTVMGWLEAIGGVRQSQFQVNIKGMYSSATSVNVAQQGSPGGSGMIPSLLYVAPIAITPRSNVIITDAWQVSGPGSGNHCASGQDPHSELCQVANLVPTTALSGWIGDLTSAVGDVIPEFKNLDYGRIVPDQAPKDRQSP